jgi:formate--tetrahydrofolate ligase
VENVRKFGVPALVVINVFPADTGAELQAVERELETAEVPASRSDVCARGGEGGRDAACALVRLLDLEHAAYQPLYRNDLPLREKIKLIATRVYRASGVDFAGTSARDLDRYERLGYGSLPVCMAKTQYSFSDDPGLTNAPDDFHITVRSTRLSAGAGFVVALSGDIMTMPGLGKNPAAERIGVEPNGRIVGLD